MYRETDIIQFNQFIVISGLFQCMQSTRKSKNIDKNLSLGSVSRLGIKNNRLLDLLAIL